MIKRLRGWIIGAPKSPLNPNVFHSVTLAAFFAWVGLGADGLSSSCYGPEEAFRALGSYTHLALFLAIAIAATVFILSASYSQVIEAFPSGGGGYLVAAKLIGPRAGVVSGSALLVDYVLTVAVSVASSMDAIFSFLPHAFLPYKLTASLVILGGLVVLNLRGVKESIQILTPIFLVFIATHAVVILYGVFSHGTELPQLVTDTMVETHQGVQTLGVFALGAIFLKAFALGGGTLTGIEAVSNGLPILREPRVETGKRTMKYMAFSLAVMAFGILLSYLLNNIKPIHGQTMNASLLSTIAQNWPLGRVFIFITLLSEGALLVVAAQAGFLDGPRTMSNMAIDSWLPRRFTNLSDRLVMKDGVLVIGLSAMAMILYTHASVRILVVMYSINVFLTFSLTQLGMLIHWMSSTDKKRFKKILLNGVGLMLTSVILVLTVVLQFTEGGWVTLVVTGSLVAFCFWVQNHYRTTKKALAHLDEILTSLPLPEEAPETHKQPTKPTAIVLVNGYSGVGIHSLLSIHRLFPGHFKNFIFVAVGVIDSDRFKGTAELENLRQNVQTDLDKYVLLSNRMGLYAESRMTLETDIISGLESLCNQVAEEWSRRVFFMSQLAFEGETFWTRLLHSRTSFNIQRKLLFHGQQAVILPIRVRMKPVSLPK